MKKSILFMSAVAMLAAASCNKPELENVGTTPEVGANEFVAYTESATKTTLNGYTTVWEAGDQIAINGISYKTSEGGERAVFTLHEGDEPEAPYLAGYPYTNVMASEGTAIDFAYLDMENELILTRNHIGDEVFAMAYNESDRSLEFKNVVSLLKFQVPSTFAEEITSITISTNEPLAGYFTAEYNGGEPTWEISEGDTSVKEIILKDEQGTFSSEATYFVPVLPGAKTNLTVKLNETVVATGLTIEFKRNTIHNIATLPAAEVKKVYLKPNLWNSGDAWFAAHFWGNDGYANGVDFKMTDDDSDGIYEVTVPNGSKNVIFCRMNPKFEEFGWNPENVTEENKRVWNQSANLSIPAAEASEIYYVISGWGEETSTGAWQTYEEATAPPVIGLVGSFQGWNVEDPIAMTDNGDGWIVAKSIDLYKDDAFKFVENKSWTVNYGGNGGVLVADVDKEYTLSQGGENIKVNNNGKFDLYFNPNTNGFKCSCIEEYTDIKVQIKVVNERTSWASVNMYLWYEENGNKVDITTSPGPALTKDASGNYVYELDGKYIGETIYYVFSNNGADQTDQDNLVASRNGHSLTISSLPPAKFTMTLDTSTLTTYWGTTAYLYVWTDAPKVEPLGGWPGKKMTYNSSKKEFTCDIPSEYIGKKLNFIVHNGNNWQTSDKVMNPVKAEQTYKGNANLGLN